MNYLPSLCVLIGVVWHIEAHAAEVSYNRDVRPILADRCFYCHGFDESHREADLRLDLRDEAEYAFDVESPDDSELIHRVASDDPDVVMPPPASHKEALTADEVALLRRWIKQGAKYEPHWAFVEPKRPEADAINLSDAIDEFVGRKLRTNGLRFAPPALPTKWLRRVSLDLTGVPPSLAELEDFSDAAHRRGAEAYEEAVDRLLASTEYGERMALEWLDVARFADTNGFQADAYHMNWPWRDWVIGAFNENMPFDRFTVEQLAGDLLEGQEGEGPTEDRLIATAFNRNHMIQAEGGSIPEENRAKNNFDRVETTGTTWLGMTVGCCQCHDHKFDPLKQADYYSLVAFFNQISETGLTSKKFEVTREGERFARKYWVDKPFIAVGERQLKQQLDEARQGVAAARQELSARRDEYIAEARAWVLGVREDPAAAESAGELKPSDPAARYLYSADLENPKETGFKKLIDAYLKQHDPWKSIQGRIDKAVAQESRVQEKIPLVMVMRDDHPRDTFVLLRGSYETPGEKVVASTPDFLPPLVVADPSRGPDRLDFARWLVSPEHPLTARVTVNRYWQLMFGRGLVSTPNDFGLQGAYPTHPELLDWLAVEFREGGWDLKAFLKGIALSRTYRQSARASEESFRVDPSNKWLGRGTRLRLDSRLLRDQALALSGLLHSEVGGPPVAPYQPPGIWEAISLNANHYVRDEGKDLYRRSLYTVWRRAVAPANFFDTPNRQGCSVTLTRTNTPLHALTTLNDSTYVEAARAWAGNLPERLDEDKRLSLAFYSATGRRPDSGELALLVDSLEKARRRYGANPDAAARLLAIGESPAATEVPAPEQAAWTTVCLMVLNLDETICK